MISSALIASMRHIFTPNEGHVDFLQLCELWVAAPEWNVCTDIGRAERAGS